MTAVWFHSIIQPLFESMMSTAQIKRNKTELVPKCENKETEYK